MRFSHEEKTKAVILFETLQEMQKIFLENLKNISKKNLEKNIGELEEFGRKKLKSEKLVEKIYYCEIRDAKTLKKINSQKSPQAGDIILISVQFAGIHLIDNWIFEGGSYFKKIS